MIATLISKGQITVPREIRDLLGLAVGSMLDFQMPPGSLLISDVQQDDAARLLAVRSLLEAPPLPLRIARPSQPRQHVFGRLAVALSAA